MNTREDKFLRALGDIDETLVEDIVARSGDKSKGIKAVRGQIMSISEGPVPEPKHNKPRIAVISGIAAALVLTGSIALAVNFSNVQTGSHGIEITLDPEVEKSALEEINRPTEEASTVQDYVTSADTTKEIGETVTESSGDRGDMVSSDILITPGSQTTAPQTSGAVSPAAGTADETASEDTTTVSTMTENTAYTPTDDELKALIAQGAEACGVSVTVSDLKTSGLTLNYSIDESFKFADKISYTWYNRYKLEIPGDHVDWVTYDPDNVEKTTWWDGLFDLGGGWGNETEEDVLFYGEYDYDNELPAGKYRIVKELGAASADTGEKLGYLTVYAEFEITASMPNQFGITMTAKEVTPESLTLVVQQSGGSFHNKNRLGYIEAYDIGHKDAFGDWEGVLIPADEPEWSGEIKPLKENGVTEIPVDLGNYYGDLQSGTYRISLRFVNYSVTGASTVVNSSVYSTEFTIGSGERDNTYGITMRAMHVTPEGLMLFYSQMGGSYKGTLGFGSYFEIERYNNDTQSYEKVPYIPSEYDIAWTADLQLIEKGRNTSETLNWSSIYGSLPPGSYRVSKVIGDYPESGTGLPYSEHKYYADFDIPDSNSITLRVENVTSEGIKVTVETNFSDPDHEVHYGSEYSIQRRNGSQWEELPYIHDNIGWTDIAYILGANTTADWEINWSYMYGALPAGKYRYVKEFNDVVYYAEFDIPEETGSKLGITMYSDGNTAVRGTFRINQNGGSMSGEIWYDPSWWVEAYTGSEWTAVETLNGQPLTWNAIAQKLERGRETLFTADWETSYGALPPGRYRIGKTFRCEDVTETAYAVFTVTENMTNGWGISVKVSNATAEGMTLVVSQWSDAEWDYDILYDPVGTVEKLDTNGKWVKVEPQTDSSDAQTTERKLWKGIASSREVKWKDMGLTLTPGSYRYSLTFHSGAGVPGQSMTLSSEFEII